MRLFIKLSFFCLFAVAYTDTPLTLQIDVLKVNDVDYTSNLVILLLELKKNRTGK